MKYTEWAVNRKKNLLDAYEKAIDSINRASDELDIAIKVKDEIKKSLEAYKDIEIEEEE